MKDLLFRKNHKIDVKSTTMPLAEEKNNDRLVPYRANTLLCKSYGKKTEIDTFQSYKENF